MNNLCFQTFAVIGLCFILKYGSILNFVRTPLLKIGFCKKLLKCALCLGFWCGVAMGIYDNENWFIWGLYGSAVCWVADHVVMVLNKMVNYSKDCHSKDPTDYPNSDP